MAKLTRYTQDIFGSTAAANRISEFGSLQAGTPTTYSGATVTPADIQALSNFLQGWDGAVIGNNSPPIQDMNAVHYLYSYQLAYILQEGIAEYDAGTTYYTYSLCMYLGVVYQSLIDSNIGNTPSTSPSDWSIFSRAVKAPTQQVFATGTLATYTTPSNPAPLYLQVEIVGAGGGGGGGGTSGGTGGVGGTTSFGISSINQYAVFGGTGGGGSGSPEFSSGGVGSGLDTSGSFGFAFSCFGNCGTNGMDTSASSAPGGTGGGSFFGGGGLGGIPAEAGSNGQSYGGGGGGGSANGSLPTGGGGGAGGYANIKISSPTTSYTYSVGAAGTAGTAGSGSGASAGGPGAGGVVRVTEFYQ